MKTLKQIREASGGKEAYQKFFNSMLKKFGVNSPSELEGKKKKEFFDAIDKGWDGDNEPKEKGEQTETYTDPDDLDPETTHNPDELELATGKKLGEKVKPPKQGDRDEYYRRVDKVDKAWGIGAGKKSLSDLSKGDLKKYFKDRDKALGHDIFDSVKKPNLVKVTETSDTEDEKLISEVFSKAQMKKAIGIARKSKGQYTKAYNAIEKIKKGLADEHIIAAALKRANEAHEVGTDKYVKHCKKMVPGQNESVKLTKWSINEMKAEIEFQWDNDLDMRKHKRLMKKHKLKVTPLSLKGPGGVDVDHFATVVGKKENIRAWMKDWDYDYDASEYKDMGLGLKGESVNEVVKAGRGNIKGVGVDLDATDYPGGEKQYVKDVKKRFKVTVKLVRYGADLSGKKADIIQFLFSDMYGGVEDSDIEDMWPELLEATTRYRLFKEAARNPNNPYVRKLSKPAQKVFHTVMYNILKKGIDPYSAAAHRAEVDLVGSRLSDKDLAAVKMAVQNESVKEAVDVDCRLMGFKAAVRRAEGEKQKGRVIVDRRTKGAKEARLRAEKARAKREAIAAAKKKKEFTEKYPQLDYGYLDDAEVKEIENAANRKLYGETAANSVSSGNVDMAINMGKKKKKDKVIKRADY